ncbi:putative conserved membrane protein [Synechococcus sp. RS9909]|uniref:hypothetical protein n=1 Tax=unclassified Synechococcus TaxID=2626047 RepID=UPI00006905C9|nr:MULTISPECIES: hypothetical protein [unclassified Synechococcus]EAQ70551.1 hypothetical protein RS9917_06930 [Synechococcus sp. RS9917]QNI80574.1 putative conserved membrane protein [Synechococcus sp. RS9909]
MADTPVSSRLHVLKAVEDGWNAFTKAPWPFVLFALIVGVLSVVFQLIGNAATGGGDNTTVGVGGIILTIVALIGSWIVSLWGVTGMVRGSWIALDGSKPSFADFSRWDGAAAGRLFVRWIALGIVFLVIAIICGLVGFGLAQLNQVLLWIPAAVGLILFVYLSVNQKFLPYVALLEQRGPFETVQRGRDVVDPSWWWVVLLLIVDAVIIVIGTLLCGVGLLVAAPVVACITTAAYRQLFGSEDQTGLLSGN